ASQDLQKSKGVVDLFPYLLMVRSVQNPVVQRPRGGLFGQDLRPFGMVFITIESIFVDLATRNLLIPLSFRDLCDDPLGGELKGGATLIQQGVGNPGELQLQTEPFCFFVITKIIGIGGDREVGEEVFNPFQEKIKTSGSRQATERVARLFGKVEDKNSSVF